MAGSAAAPSGFCAQRILRVAALLALFAANHEAQRAPPPPPLPTPPSPSPRPTGNGWGAAQSQRLPPKAPRRDTGGDRAAQANGTAPVAAESPKEPEPEPANSAVRATSDDRMCPWERTAGAAGATHWSSEGRTYVQAPPDAERAQWWNSSGPWGGGLSLAGYQWTCPRDRLTGAKGAVQQMEFGDTAYSGVPTWYQRGYDGITDRLTARSCEDGNYRRVCVPGTCECQVAEILDPRACDVAQAACDTAAAASGGPAACASASAERPKGVDDPNGPPGCRIRWDDAAHASGTWEFNWRFSMDVAVTSASSDIPGRPARSQISWSYRRLGDEAGDYKPWRANSTFTAICLQLDERRVGPAVDGSRWGSERLGRKWVDHATVAPSLPYTQAPQPFTVAISCALAICAVIAGCAVITKSKMRTRSSHECERITFEHLARQDAEDANKAECRRLAAEGNIGAAGSVRARYFLPSSKRPIACACANARILSRTVVTKYPGASRPVRRR
jgi:hypothetical protein